MIDPADRQALIAATNWRSVFHAYGRADDTPGHLRALIGDDARAFEDALVHLNSAVLHQGTPWSATPPAVRVVVGFILSGAVPPGSRRLEGMVGFLAGIADTLAQIPDAKYRARFEQSVRTDISGPLAQAIALYDREESEGEDRNYLDTLGDAASEVYFDTVCLDLMNLAPAIMQVLQLALSDPRPETRSMAAKGCSDLIAGGHCLEGPQGMVASQHPWRQIAKVTLAF